MTSMKLTVEVAAKLDAFRRKLDAREKREARKAGIRSIPRPVSMGEALAVLLYRMDKKAARSRAARKRGKSCLDS